MRASPVFVPRVVRFSVAEYYEYSYPCPECDVILTGRVWKSRLLRQRFRCAIQQHARNAHDLGDRDRSLLADRACREARL
jgi:hypothetical protein